MSVLPAWRKGLLSPLSFAHHLRWTARSKRTTKLPVAADSVLNITENIFKVDLPTTLACPHSGWRDCCRFLKMTSASTNSSAHLAQLQRLSHKCQIRFKSSIIPEFPFQSPDTQGWKHMWVWQVTQNSHASNIRTPLQQLLSSWAKLCGHVGKRAALASCKIFKATEEANTIPRNPQAHTFARWSSYILRCWHSRLSGLEG